MRLKHLLFACYIIALTFLTQGVFANTPSDLKKYNFKFNGKVTCLKPEGDIVGMYGAKIKLHVLRKIGVNNSDKDLVIDNLTGIGLDPKDLIVDVAADGSFKFDLEFTSNLQLVKFLFFEVYPGGDHGYVVSDEPQFITQTSKGEVFLYSDVVKGQDPFRGVRFYFDEGQTTYTYNNLSIEVNPKIGTTSRYLKFSHDFGEILYTRSFPGELLHIPAVVVKITNNGVPSGAGAIFQPTIFNEPTISVSPKYATYSFYISHEFGHYFHFLINKAHLLKANPNDHEKMAAEGFSEFYEMLIDNYASSVYKDNVTYNKGEKLPFINPAYDNTTYSGKWNNNVPRFATYLFNLYDGPTQWYMQKKHTGGDNEDIDGIKEGSFGQICRIIKAMGKYDMYISTFHSKMKAKVSPEAAASIQKMYDFIFNDNKAGMPCAQVKEATLTVLDGGKTHALRLKTYAYTDTGAQYYKNKAIGYKLYGWKANTWKLIKTLPETDKEVKFYTLDTKDIETYTEFKVSAYNASGESLHPVLFKNSSMAVNIEGPTDIYADVSYQWYAKLWGNDAYTYSWRLKDPVTNQYYPLGQTGPSKSFTTKAPAGKNFILQVFVADNVAGVSGYKEISVNTTIRPLKANIMGPETFAYNAPTKWTASIDGGLPPYSYMWTKKTEGDFKDIVIGQTDNCNITSQKNFTLKLVVKDAQGNVAFNTKQIVIDPTATIHVSITGDKIAYLHKAIYLKAAYTGGEPFYGPVTWYKRKEGQNYTGELFSEGSECTDEPKEEGVYYVKARVKDKNGIAGESPEFKVTAIYQPMYASIGKGEKVTVIQGEEEIWFGYVTGGKHDYLYQWKVGKSLDALTLIKEESGYGLKTLCHYTPSINDLGKYFISLSITDGFNKKITVNQEFTVVKATPFTPPLTITATPPKQNVFSYSPNPVQSSFTVSFDMQKNAYVQLSLIDSKDKSETKLYEQQCTKGIYRKTFNTGLLKNGVYIIQLRWRDDKGINTAIDKIIIAK